MHDGNFFFPYANKIESPIWMHYLSQIHDKIYHCSVLHGKMSQYLFCDLLFHTFLFTLYFISNARTIITDVYRRTFL